MLTVMDNKIHGLLRVPPLAIDTTELMLNLPMTLKTLSKGMSAKSKSERKLRS